MTSYEKLRQNLIFCLKHVCWKICSVSKALGCVGGVYFLECWVSKLYCKMSGIFCHFLLTLRLSTRKPKIKKINSKYGFVSFLFWSKFHFLRTVPGRSSQNNFKIFVAVQLVDTFTQSHTINKLLAALYIKIQKAIFERKKKRLKRCCGLSLVLFYL